MVILRNILAIKRLSIFIILGLNFAECGFVVLFAVLGVEFETEFDPILGFWGTLTRRVCPSI